MSSAMHSGCIRYYIKPFIIHIDSVMEFVGRPFASSAPDHPSNPFNFLQAGLGKHLRRHLHDGFLYTFRMIAKDSWNPMMFQTYIPGSFPNRYETCRNESLHGHLVGINNVINTLYALMERNFPEGLSNSVDFPTGMPYGNIMKLEYFQIIFQRSRNGPRIYIWKVPFL